VNKIFCLWVFLVCPMAYADSVKDVTQATFRIENMTCKVCPITVRKAMGGVEGVTEVSMDYAHKTATVVFDATQTTVSEIANASNNAGYPAHPNREPRP